MTSSRGDGPLVSIVTPTLNQGDFIEATIRSIKAQTYERLEHIVIDGGSTDGTLEILRRHEGTYPMRWLSEPDRGMYDAINKGLRMANGEIVAYLNSDDLYFPWTIDIVVEAFRDDGGADVVYGDAVRIDEINARVIPVFQPPFEMARTATFGSLIQPAVFMHRRVLDALGGFDDSLRYVADLEFWLRAGERFRFARIAEFLALEQRHAGMLSVAKREEMAIEDAKMRRVVRAGFGASTIDRVAGRVRVHLWLGRYWFEFVLATRGRGDGWRRTCEAARPSVAAGAAVLGLLPSAGGRRRAAVRWASDPLSIASAARTDPEF